MYVLHVPCSVLRMLAIILENISRILLNKRAHQRFGSLFITSISEPTHLFAVDSTFSFCFLFQSKFKQLIYFPLNCRMLTDEDRGPSLVKSYRLVSLLVFLDKWSDGVIWIGWLGFCIKKSYLRADERCVDRMVQRNVWMNLVKTDGSLWDYFSEKEAEWRC